MKIPDRVHLIMADDDGDDCVLARCAFEAAMISGEIRFLGDGRELMEYLQNDGELPSQKVSLPDLILLDLNMPRKDGREALMEIKSSPGLRNIPIVIFSTSREEHDIEFCRKAGANGFIKKPVLFEEWIDAFRSLVRHLSTGSWAGSGSAASSTGTS